MKKYSEMYYDDRSIILTRWYEGAFSYDMENLAKCVNDIYDVDEVESFFQNEVDIEVENTDFEVNDVNSIEFDDIDMFKKDMVDYLMGVYEEMYLDKD